MYIEFHTDMFFINLIPIFIVSAWIPALDCTYGCIITTIVAIKWTTATQYLVLTTMHSMLIIKPYQTLYLRATSLKLSMALNVTSSSSSKIASRLCSRHALYLILYIKILLTWKLLQSHGREFLCCLNTFSMIYRTC